MAAATCLRNLWGPADAQQIMAAASTLNGSNREIDLPFDGKNARAGRAARRLRRRRFASAHAPGELIMASMCDMLAQMGFEPETSDSDIVMAHGGDAWRRSSSKEKRDRQEMSRTNYQLFESNRRHGAYWHYQKDATFTFSPSLSY